MKTTTWTGGAADGDPANASNWSNGAPVSDDTVVFEFLATAGPSTNLAALAAINPAVLEIAQSYTGTIGTATAAWQLGTPGVTRIGHHYGTGTPSGSGRIHLDLKARSGSIAAEVDVYNTAVSPTDADKPPCRLLIDEPDAIVRVRKGSVGIAVGAPGETSSVDEIHVTHSGGRSDAKVFVGEGVTYNKLVCAGGETVVENAPAGCEIVVDAGTLTVEADGDTIATYSIEAGATCYLNGGDVVDANFNGGTTDCLQSTRSRSIGAGGTVNWKPGAKLRMDPAYVTLAVANLSLAERMVLSAAKP